MGELCVFFLFWKFDASWPWWVAFVVCLLLSIFGELRKIRRRWVQQMQYEQMWDFYKEKK